MLMMLHLHIYQNDDDEVDDNKEDECHIHANPPAGF